MKIPNHTQFPNEIIDEGHLKEMTGVELKVLLVICRKTIGWHKISDRISYRQLQKFTGSGMHNIQKGIESLIKKGFIIQEKGEKGCVYDINFNEKDRESVAKTATPINSECGQNGNKGVAETATGCGQNSNAPVAETATTKEIKDTNNNINKDSLPAEKPDDGKVKNLHHDCVKIFNDLFYQKNGIAFPFKYGKIDSKMIKNVLELMKITKVEDFRAIVTVAINHPFWGGQKLNPTVLYTHIQEFIPGGKNNVYKNNFSQGSRNSTANPRPSKYKSLVYEDLPKMSGDWKS